MRQVDVLFRDSFECEEEALRTSCQRHDRGSHGTVTNGRNEWRDVNGEEDDDDDAKFKMLGAVQIWRFGSLDIISLICYS